MSDSDVDSISASSLSSDSSTGSSVSMITATALPSTTTMPYRTLSFSDPSDSEDGDFLLVPPVPKCFDLSAPLDDLACGTEAASLKRRLTDKQSQTNLTFNSKELGSRLIGSVPMHTPYFAANANIKRVDAYINTIVLLYIMVYQPQDYTDYTRVLFD